MAKKKIVEQDEEVVIPEIVPFEEPDLAARRKLRESK